MNLNKIVIVLSNPDESRNIGAVCRAMANNGLYDLKIVGKKNNYNDEKVRILAIHAVNIWENCKFYNSITKATQNCTIVAGTTRRRGKKRKGKLLLPEELAELSSKITGTEKSKGSNVAIVFGNERTGLTDEELAECTLGVTIPSSPEFASLNLSHAVQIIAYHLYRNKTKVSPGYTPLTLNRLDKTVTTIADKLQEIGFFTLSGRTDMEKFWRMILSQAALSESDATYIEKIFTKIVGLSKKNNSIPKK